MHTAAPRYEATLLTSIDAVAATEWNALASNGVPFVRHEFLAALEHSGAVGGRTGWRPRPLLLRDNGRLVGAVPLYEKDHSFGEFVFDFAWANAYTQNGMDYYPKLVAATPFTPATGPRLLTHPAEEAPTLRAALVAALDAVMAAGVWSSLHIQFATESDVTALESGGFLPRIDCQFLWENKDYDSFDAFLGTFTADKRKKAKRERRRILEAGIRHEWRDGASLADADWAVIHALLATTFHRHGHAPYLPAAFFIEVSRHPATEPRVLLAHLGEQVVAAALFFRGADTLYGRYWGCTEAHHSLHFETCYHQGIEYAINEGLARFEPGTQGEHKIARGFAPTLTHSAHRLRDPRFATAIGRYLEEERASILHYRDSAGAHTPFRRDLPLLEAP
ncbi:MAG: GNAT family N-acetyltransferase [Pseudomonadota bacterium]